MMKRHGKVESYPQNRRSFFLNTIITTSILFSIPSVGTAASPRLDVNNALAREYTAFPGLYPTIATKLVNAAKEEPFKNKKEVYKVLNEIEQDRLNNMIVPLSLIQSTRNFNNSKPLRYANMNVVEDPVRLIETNKLKEFKTSGIKKTKTKTKLKIEKKMSLILKVSIKCFGGE